MTKKDAYTKYVKKWKGAKKKANDVSLHLIHRARWQELTDIYAEMVRDLQR
jgi:hypothetical protein